jgi:hypothetical protein
MSSDSSFFLLDRSYQENSLGCGPRQDHQRVDHAASLSTTSPLALISREKGAVDESFFVFHFEHDYHDMERDLSAVIIR